MKEFRLFLRNRNSTFTPKKIKFSLVKLINPQNQSKFLKSLYSGVNYEFLFRPRSWNSFMFAINAIINMKISLIAKITFAFGK